MRKLAIVAMLVLITSLAGLTKAQAGLVTPFKKSDSTVVTVKKIKKNLRHVKFVCDMGKGSVERQHCKATLWLHTWLKHELVKLRPALYVPHYNQWLCIHHYEGSWTDSGDPYWGGLQMDKNFMRNYAPSWLLRKGWANKWTPLQQMWVAEQAHSYSPWPNTARYCGLL